MVLDMFILMGYLLEYLLVVFVQYEMELGYNNDNNTNTNTNAKYEIGNTIYFVIGYY